MRWLTFLTAALLPLTSLAAKKPAADKYTTYRTQSLSTPALKLDDSKYNKLTATPRDYTVAVLLTALDARFGCQLCRDFQPEWELLAKSWVKGDKKGESRTVFGTLDFADGRNTFQALQLQTAPILLLFPPTHGPNSVPTTSPIRFDFSTGPQSAETIHAFITRHLPDTPSPKLSRPIKWLRIISISTAVLGGVSAVTVLAPYLMPVLQNRTLWAAVSLIAVLLFTSGHMFNHIRKVPYMQGDGKGGVNYFAGGFQNQFGLESQIVAVIYGILAFATISLALKVPRIQDPKKQQAAVFIWCAVTFGTYSFLMSVFRIKNGGYPFFLPPF